MVHVDWPCKQPTVPAGGLLKWHVGIGGEVLGCWGGGTWTNKLIILTFQICQTFQRFRPNLRGPRQETPNIDNKVYVDLQDGDTLGQNGNLDYNLCTCGRSFIIHLN